MVIGMDREVEESSFCPKITLDPQLWVDRKHVSAWSVPLDERWNEANIWQEKLQSFLS
jgi:hypothetical protein